MSDERYDDEPTGLEIAILGMACRVPGAADVDEFWDNLARGVESITHLSEEELRAAGEPEASLTHPGYVPVARAIEGYDLFDAGFFGMSPREAEVTDPQQRMLLELAWQALENAGYDSETFPGVVGVYAGGRLSTYLMQLFGHPGISLGDLQVSSGNDKDYFATRIAYKLSLGGPCVTVQCACSTSLVATHLACQTLLSGECDMALAGGVSLIAPPVGYVYREGDLFSPDGRIRAFSADAGGTIFGSGMGFVVLKRLEDALADRDPIRAVIKGSAVTNDASHRAGFTAPGVDGQRRAVRGALDASGVHPDTITYVEAHGTGTPTGDPIEVSALTSAYREQTRRTGYCALGSVKTNIGHLSSAAGVVGLIKTVLALEHKEIPASLNFTAPNPQIDFAASPFFVNAEHRAWETEDGMPRRAGVSAFGIGGTNAHVIVEEAPAPPPPAPGRPWQLVTLAARSASALETMTDRLAEHLGAGASDLADAAYTLQVGRRPFEHRRTLVCRDAEDAARALAERDPKRLRTLSAAGKKRRTAFLFSGQGAQYPGMGRGLYESEAVFRETVDGCCDKLEAHLGRDLRALLYPAAESDVEAAADLLRETRFTQPALFVVEYAMARLWQSWGVEPEAMIGHSIGEYVAACLAGVFDLDAGLALVAARGRLMHGLPAGAMLSVPLSEEELAPRLDRQLSIAALNAPGRSVVSGPTEAVAAFAERMRAEGVACSPLHTSHAFHSEMMEPILPRFLEEVRRVDLQPPRARYVSNLTGDWITAAEATDPNYWVLHLRRAVRFADGVAKILEDDPRCVLLEVGPGKTLASLAQRHPARGKDHLVASSLRHPKDADADDLAFALAALGQLWQSGVEVDWPGFYAGEARRRVALPTYPFERRRFWVERAPLDLQAGAAAAGPRPLAEWFYLPTWKPTLAPVLAPPPAEPETWAVFADGEGLGDAAAARLRERGQRVVEVRRGAAFEREAEHAFRIRPGVRDDYRELFDRLAEHDLLPRHVLHLWNVTAGPEPAAAALERAFYGLLYLAQALGTRKIEGGVRLGVISNNACKLPAGGESFTCPEKAALLGPCQVMGREYPHLKAMSLDVTLPEARELVDRLIAETAALTPEETGTSVAYRRGERWRRDYEAVKVDAAAEEIGLRRGGVYLITGGLGGFGLTFADYLAREAGARLVLLGRSELPPRESWEDWLASHPEDERVSRRLRRVLELEELGAEVLALAADVTDRAAMERVVAETRERFGPIAGVIHAAGVPGGGLMQLKDPEAAGAVLAPKVAGTLALEAALASEEPDFVVLCSSTIAVLGTPGQVDYCAANAFLDAFAESRAGAARRVVSINWGAWQEVGMAVETPPVPAAAASGEKAPAAPPPAVDPEAAVHPLLERCLTEKDDEAVYQTFLSAERHWVIDEHRILDTPTVPGTTWIELARAAYAHRVGGDAPLEVSRLFFYQPLQVAADGYRELRVVLDQREETDAGPRFRFRALSGGGDAWTTHATAKVGPAAEAAAAAHDLQAIRGRCEPVDLSGYQRENKFVYWGPRWDSLEGIELGDREGLVSLRLGDEYVGDLEAMALHPALVDVATALTSGLAEGGNFLPLSYERVVVRSALPPVLSAYIRLLTEDLAGETMSADVALVDGEGRELVTLEHFTMKRVGGARDRLAPADGGAKAPARQGLFAAGGMRPAEGVEALRRVLSRVPWPRVVVSPKDLAAMRRQMAAGPDLEAAAEAGGAGSGSSHPRPELATPYEAPRTGAERLLASIWEEVLGVDEVGIHDNFFELGGDSVMGVRLVSRANESGLEMAPDQLFQFQTVAELAEQVAAGEAPAPAAEQQEAEPVGAFADSGLGADELEKVMSKLQEMGN